MRIALCSAALTVSGLLAGCDGRQAVPPTGPSEVTTQPSIFVRLSGTVTEATETGPTPVVGAVVREVDSRLFGVTDAGGHYHIDHVPLASRSTMTASKSGYLTNGAVRTITGDTTVDIELSRRPVYTLTGVISEMTPSGPVGIEGVGVSFLAYVSSDNWAQGETTTDAEGRYHLTGLWGPDAYTGIWLVKAGYRIGAQLDPSCDGCFQTLTIAGDSVFDVQLARLPVTPLTLSRDYNSFLAFAKGSPR